MLSFSELNYLAIVLATIAKFMVGGLWFSKMLFGNAWLAEVGLKDGAFIRIRRPQSEIVPDICDPMCNGICDCSAYFKFNVMV